MNETIVLTITQEHINNGVPTIPYKCPLALALKELFSTNALDGEWVSVGTTTCTVGTKDVVKDYDLSLDARNFVHSFDQEASGEGPPLQVEPGVFVLTLISEYSIVLTN